MKIGQIGLQQLKVFLQTFMRGIIFSKYKLWMQTLMKVKSKAFYFLLVHLGIDHIYFIYVLAALIWFFGKYQAKRSLVKAENERRENDLEEAKQIQESMLLNHIHKLMG